MRNLILSALDRQPDFPKVSNNFRLVHPSGLFVITESIRGVLAEDFDRIIILVAKNDVIDPSLKEDIEEEFFDIFSIEPEFYEVVSSYSVLSKHIVSCIKKLELEGSIYLTWYLNRYNIKEIPSGNTIVTADFSNNSHIHLHDKYFCDKNLCVRYNDICNTKIIVGFNFEVKDYLNNFVPFSPPICQTVNKVFSEGKNVTEVVSSDYVDWGTTPLWELYRSNYGIIFIDLDGVLVRYVSRHNKNLSIYKPGMIISNVNTINRLYRKGKHYIILLTFRPDTTETHDLIKEYGIKYHRLIADLPENHKTIISSFDYHHKFPYAEAVNLPKNTETLKWRYGNEPRYRDYQ